MKRYPTIGGYPAGRAVADGPMPVPFPKRPHDSRDFVVGFDAAHPGFVSLPTATSGTLDLALDAAARVALNVRRHLTARRWTVDRLDAAMADLGWGGAHWHATPATRPLIHEDPIAALHQLLDGERHLVVDEEHALATALGVPYDHLYALPQPPQPRRRSRWARLFGGRR